MPVTNNGSTNGHAVSALIPALGLSLGIKSDPAFSNGVARLNDLTKEAMLQAIKEQDLRFLSVWIYRLKTNKLMVLLLASRMTVTRQS